MFEQAGIFAGFSGGKQKPIEVYGVKRRKPYESEMKYFKDNPNVSGMAAEDDHVILNPYSKLSEEQQGVVIKNESARVKIRQNPKLKPTFKLTKEQHEQFKGYSKKMQDIQDTIAARIISGDPSAGVTTKEQQAYVKRFNDYLESEKKAQNNRDRIGGMWTNGNR